MINGAITPISDGVAPVSYNAGRFAYGVGSVILSRELTRDKYIANCFKDSVVTIRTNDGAILKNCLVCKSVWNDIKFPTNNRGKGSSLVWLNIPIANRPIILGVLDKKEEWNEHEQDSSRMGNSDDDSSSSIKTEGNGRVSLLSESIGIGGGVFIHVVNSENDGEFKVFVQGGIDLESERDATIKSASKIEFIVSDEDVDAESEDEEEPEVGVTIMKITDGEGLFYKDEFDNFFIFNEEGAEIHDFNNNSIDLSDLGTKLVSKFGDVIDMKELMILLELKNAGGTIELIAKDYEENKEKALLADKTIDVFTDIITEISNLCDNLSKATVVTVNGASPFNPADILLMQQTSVKVKAIKGKLKLVKSKNVYIT